MIRAALATAAAFAAVVGLTLALSSCGRDWLSWQVPARPISDEPVELVCHETPHAFGESPPLSCVEA